MPTANDFSLIDDVLPQIGEEEVMVQVRYISIDPAMRGWMNEGTTYIKGVAIGEVMRAFAIGKVVQSNHQQFAEGDVVTGLLGVQEVAVVNGSQLTKVVANNIPLSWFIGIYGMPGLTAYYGLLDKGNPQPNDVVLVSGAAGMVGSIVAQIAKLKDYKVIGIAGGAAKCAYLKNELVLDEVIDYKNENINERLAAIAPNGVNIYFDNVGGDTLDTALLHLAQGARVVICGAIAQYNEANFLGLKNYMKIVSARGTLTGIIVLDYFHKANEAISQLQDWVANGQLKYREHIVKGIEQFPETLQMLFTGKNNGKLVLKINQN